MQLTKKRTTQNRQFTIECNGLTVGKLYAVYRTPSQFHWEGQVVVETTAKDEFEYHDDNALSSKQFMVACQTEAEKFFAAAEDVLPLSAVIQLNAEPVDRTIQMLYNSDGKPIPMSDLVKEATLPIPKVTAEKLSDYDNTETDPIYEFDDWD